MRLPLSLHARLSVGAILLSVSALTLVTYSIIDIINGVLSDNIDIAFDAHINVIDHAVDKDGNFHPDQVAGFPDLAGPGAQWGWQVEAVNGQWKKGSMPANTYYPWPRIHPSGGIYSGIGMATDGSELHIRRLETRRQGHPVSITVIASSILINGPLGQARDAIYRSLALFILVLVATAIVQLRYGLRPLRRLGKDLLQIRNGEVQRLPDGQPAELAPLADQINGLIALNNSGLEVARMNAANLAHSVKTPLSSLMLQLEHEGASAEARALVASISQRVAHHLKRARNGAGSLGARVRTDAYPLVEAIRPVLASIRRHQPVHIDNRLPQPTHIGIDPEDLSELLGNLLENACRYAGAQVVVSAREDGVDRTIQVEDDGAGIPAEDLARVLQPGVRLDEVTEGYGFGLAIVRELVGLYGGTLVLARSPALGGLCATLRFPK
ncbi:HAMP domain-containing protein [Duganella sp. FT80W]|uniref:histidine kinase n=1 Tax=Duganella guangzhouensis TaxID=2666084 RepID=A0A6I2L2L5_9BURK|nr:HAMP domain-containing protein [Duganella guangzhouensis]